MPWQNLLQKPPRYCHKQRVEKAVGGWCRELAPGLSPPGGWRSLKERHKGRDGVAAYVNEVREWLHGDERLRQLCVWDPTTKRGLPRKTDSDWNTFLKEIVAPAYNQPAGCGLELDADTGRALEKISLEELHEFLELPDAVAAAPHRMAVDAHLQGEDAAAAVGDAISRKRAREEEAAPVQAEVQATPVGFVHTYLHLLNNLKAHIDAHLAATNGGEELPEDERKVLLAQTDELRGRLEAHRNGKCLHYRGEITLAASQPGSLTARLGRILARMADEDARSVESGPAPLPTPNSYVEVVQSSTYRTLSL